MAKQKQITECPKCRWTSLHIMFLIKTDEIIHIGDVIKPLIWIEVLKSKIKASCNKNDCPQKFWYYPSTGRVTRRTK